jgi:hypothetical protein
MALNAEKTFALRMIFFGGIHHLKIVTTIHVSFIAKKC